MRFSNRRWMKYGAEQQNADARSVAFVVATFFCLLLALLLVGCATAIKPEDKLVSSVTSLPPVDVPVSVRCVKPPGGCVGANPADKCQEMPVIPNIAIDPNAATRERSYQKKEAILAYEKYVIDANAALLGCAAKEPK
jgi:hypothetical protein